MKIAPSVLVSLGFGKYVRSDRVIALVPIDGEERGSGRRTYVYLEDKNAPLIASRSEATILRDLVQEPAEITQSRQQQEILEDLLSNLAPLNPTVRRISKDEGLDLDLLEKRIRQVLEI